MPSKKMIVPTMKTLFAIAVLATTVAKASAEDWCRINEHNLLSCGFQTKEQCQAMLSGRAGSCNPNPFPGKPVAHHPIAISSHAELMACQAMKLDCVGGGASSAFAYAAKKGAAHRTK